MSRKTSSTPPERTRAVVCAGGGKTRVEEVRCPPPGRGEILLRLRCAGLCGTDLFKLLYDKVPPGTVLGHEIVGEVAAAGEGVSGFAIGDRVVVSHHVPCGECALCVRGSETLCGVFRENLLRPGGFSEHVLVRERAVRRAARKLPPEVADEAAIFVEPGACVLRGIRRSGLRAPEGGDPSMLSAVVFGAGSMGLLHVLVLRALFPGIRILACDTRLERLELAREHGADGAFVPEEIAAAVRERTGGLGADVVFDTVGGSAPLDVALGIVREGGTVVLFAHAPEGDRAGFDINRFFRSERRLLGTYSGTVEEQDEVFRLIAAGRLDPARLVTHRLPLERFEEGVELCRRFQALKVLLVPEGVTS